VVGEAHPVNWRMQVYSTDTDIPSPLLKTLIEDITFCFYNIKYIYIYIYIYREYVFCEVLSINKRIVVFQAVKYAFSLSLSIYIYTHTHTHTHTDIYIYIYSVYLA
jgi:hypothetical protein